MRSGRPAQVRNGGRGGGGRGRHLPTLRLPPTRASMRGGGRPTAASPALPPRQPQQLTPLGPSPPTTTSPTSTTASGLDLASSPPTPVVNSSRKCVRSCAGVLTCLLSVLACPLPSVVRATLAGSVAMFQASVVLRWPTLRSPLDRCADYRTLPDFAEPEPSHAGH